MWGSFFTYILSHCSSSRKLSQDDPNFTAYLHEPTQTPYPLTHSFPFFFPLKWCAQYSSAITKVIYLREKRKAFFQVKKIFNLFLAKCKIPFTARILRRSKEKYDSTLQPHWWFQIFTSMNHRIKSEIILWANSRMPIRPWHWVLHPVFP